MQNRDNEVDLARERLKRRPARVAGRLFRRFGNIRIGKPNRRVEVRQFPRRWTAPTGGAA